MALCTFYIFIILLQYEIGRASISFEDLLSRNEGLLYLLLNTFLLHKDGFRGRSLGKLLMGIRVVDDTTGELGGFKASVKRNLPLFIPFVPLIAAFQLRKGYRIGDRWANTRVIWMKFKDKAPFAIGNVG